MKELECDFKRTINWKKYHSELTEQVQNRYLDYLIYPSFHGANRLFVIPFENKTNREVHTDNYLPKREIKDYNATIDGINFFDQPIKNDQITLDNIWKTATDQGDDYTTGCLLDCPYFTKYCNLIAIDLSKQHKPDADLKAIQEINFTGNLENNAAIFFRRNS